MASSFTPRTFPILKRGKKNTDSVTISKGKAVKLDTAADDAVKLCAATTDKIYGVAIADIAVGDVGEIGVIGVYPALAGGTVHRGDRIGCDASGNFIANTTDHLPVAGLSEREALSTELFEAMLTGPGPTLSA